VGLGENTVAGMPAAYSMAVGAKDVEAFLNLYDPAVRVFDAWDAWSYEGRDTWRSCVQAWFAAGGDELSVRFDDVRTLQAGDFGTLTSVVTYASAAPDGTARRELQNRITWVLRKEQGAWRIVHEHTSAPVDPAHQKAILRRA